MGHLVTRIGFHTECTGVLLPCFKFPGELGYAQLAVVGEFALIPIGVLYRIPAVRRANLISGISGGGSCRRLLHLEPHALDDVVAAVEVHIDLQGLSLFETFDLPNLTVVDGHVTRGDAFRKGIAPTRCELVDRTVVLGGVIRSGPIAAGLIQPLIDLIGLEFHSAGGRKFLRAKVRADVRTVRRRLHLDAHFSDLVRGIHNSEGIQAIIAPCVIAGGNQLFAVGHLRSVQIETGRVAGGHLVTIVGFHTECTGVLLPCCKVPVKLGSTVAAVGDFALIPVGVLHRIPAIRRANLIGIISGGVPCQWLLHLEPHALDAIAAAIVHADLQGLVVVKKSDKPDLAIVGGHIINRDVLRKLIAQHRLKFIDHAVVLRLVVGFGSVAVFVVQALTNPKSFGRHLFVRCPVHDPEVIRTLPLAVILHRQGDLVNLHFGGCAPDGVHRYGRLNIGQGKLAVTEDTCAVLGGGPALEHLTRRRSGKGAVRQGIGLLAAHDLLGDHRPATAVGVIVDCYRMVSAVCAQFPAAGKQPFADGGGGCAGLLGEEIQPHGVIGLHQLSRRQSDRDVQPPVRVACCAERGRLGIQILHWLSRLHDIQSEAQVDLSAVNQLGDPLVDLAGDGDGLVAGGDVSAIVGHDGVAHLQGRIFQLDVADHVDGLILAVHQASPFRFIVSAGEQFVNQPDLCGLVSGAIIPVRVRLSLCHQNGICREDRPERLQVVLVQFSLRRVSAMEIRSHVIIGAIRIQKAQCGKLELMLRVADLVALIIGVVSGGIVVGAAPDRHIQSHVARFRPVFPHIDGLFKVAAVDHAARLACGFGMCKKQDATIKGAAVDHGAAAGTHIHGKFLVDQVKVPLIAVPFSGADQRTAVDLHGPAVLDHRICGLRSLRRPHGQLAAVHGHLGTVITFDQMQTGSRGHIFAVQFAAALGVLNGQAATADINKTAAFCVILQKGHFMTMQIQRHVGIYNDLVGSSDAISVIHVGRVNVFVQPDIAAAGLLHRCLQLFIGGDHIGVVRCAAAVLCRARRHAHGGHEGERHHQCQQHAYQLTSFLFHTHSPFFVFGFLPAFPLSPLLQRINHRRKIGGGNRAVDEIVNQTVLLYLTHLIRKLFFGILIYHQHNLAVRVGFFQLVTNFHPLLQLPWCVCSNLHNQHICKHGIAQEKDFFRTFAHNRLKIGIKPSQCLRHRIRK